jgi:signal transduction histidine kinase
MTENGVADLRRFVLGLGEPGKQEGSLLPAVRRFAARFSETTGFSVSIEASEDILISDRLAAEAFQMVVEGLSNIRRHTQAVHAKLSFACRDDHLFIGIENDSPGGHAPGHFTPRSISERAKALGGEARVDVREDGRTLVEIAIPL